MPRNRVSACREGKVCTPRSCFSASREGRGCSPRRNVSPCRAGRGCSACNCFSVSGAVMLHAAVGTRVTVLALVFLPSVRAPPKSSHYSPPRARASALRAPQGAKTGVVVFLGTFPRSRHEIASEVQKSNNWTRLPLKPNSAVAYRSAHTCGRAAHLAFQDSAVYLRIARS